MTHRAGLVALVGRPNVGKSSLLNALVGMNLAITSGKPQTTRHRILGVRTQPDYQILFVDTPGIQQTHTRALNRQLNRAAFGALQEVAAVVWVIEAHRLKPEDEAVLARIPTHVPVIVALNKTDRLQSDKDRAQAFALGQRLSSMRDFHALVPVSAEQKFQIDVLAQSIAQCLPESPALVDEETVTDRGTRFFVAEIIREKLFRFLGDELPYEATVVIDRFEESLGQHGQGPQLAIAATIVVGRDSHKPMVLGEAGSRLQQIGSQARRDISEFCQARVRLDLWVKVKENWADNEALVRSFGYD